MSIVRTVLVAATSSATTAILFAACAVQTNQSATAPLSSSPTATSPASPAPPVVSASASPSATGALRVAAVSAQSQPLAAGAQNPAVSVYQQNGASVVNITSLAVVSGFGLGNAAQQQVQPQGIG